MLVETVAIDESKKLTAEQWNTYLENQKLVSWAVSRYCRNCSQATTEEMRSVFEDKLMYAIRMYKSELNIKFAYFYTYCIRREIGRYIKKQTRHNDAIEAVKHTVKDSYLDSPEIANKDNNTIPKVLDTIKLAAKSLQLTPERTDLAIRYFRGEVTYQQIATTTGLSREGVRKFVMRLQEKAKSYLSNSKATADFAI